jgi:fructokinase
MALHFRIMGIGEVLWDLLPSGAQMGGAPANFAYHARALGAEAQVISRVGNDALGREILGRFERMGLGGGTVQRDEGLPTGTVTVALSGDGVPQFTIHENVAWDRIAATADALAMVREADAVCFGTLGQRNELSRQSIQRFVAAAPEAAWRIFDINLRQHFYSRNLIERSLQLANVLKLNDTELPVLAALFGLSGNAREQLAALAQSFELRVVALTRGAQGSLLLANGLWSDHPGLTVQVVDSVGAGDAFTAAMVLGLFSGRSLDEVNAYANEVAAYVCTQPGATPALSQSLTKPWI